MPLFGEREKKNYWNYLTGKMRRVSPDEQVRLLPTLNRGDICEGDVLMRVIWRGRGAISVN